MEFWEDAPFASKSQGTHLQTGLILKLCSFLTGQLCYVAIPFVVCCQSLHSVPSISPHSVVVILLYFFLPPPPFPFHLEERACEKRSNILAEVLMVMEIIELWSIDPHTPGPQMRPPSRIPDCPQSCFPELGCWQSLPFRTQSITAQKGISPFSCHPPPSHFQPEEPVSTKFRKRELHWVNVGSWNNQEPYCSELASTEVGSNLTSPPTPAPPPNHLLPGGS